VSDLAAAEQQYESCERAYLDALRRSASCTELLRLAGDVAAAAASWNKVAYERLNAVAGEERKNLDLLTERTEVLSELWADIRSAYRHEHDALFSVIRSLWDRVVPDLRGVAYSATDSEVRVRFLFANSPSAKAVEMVSEAETECVADYWQTHEVAYLASHVPVGEPRDLEPGERWAYLRHEPSGPV
jgi:hypothetical protein